MGVFWTLGALFGALLGVAWGVLGASEAALEAMLGVWERPSGVQGLFWSLLGPPWCLLAVFCEAPGHPEGLGAHICGSGAGPGRPDPVRRYMHKTVC